jgi:hypothetical protein
MLFRINMESEHVDDITIEAGTPEAVALDLMRFILRREELPPSGTMIVEKKADRKQVLDLYRQCLQAVRWAPQQ